MKFSCSQDIFAESLSIASRAISSHNTLPVLDNIYLKATGNVLHVLATDLEISIQTVCSEIEVEEEGAFTVPAKLIVQYVQLLPAGGKVSVTKESDGALRIISPGAETRMKGIGAEEFPSIPRVDPLFQVALPAKEFADAANMVLFSTSTNSARPVLSGVCLMVKETEVILASTDSFRLSEKKISRTIPGEDAGTKVIIPAKTIAEVIRLAGREGTSEMMVSVSKNQILFELGETKLTSRLIEGIFPDYTQIIPKEESLTCTIAKDSLMLALKRINLFAKDQNFHVKFDFAPEKQELTLYTDTSEVGEERTVVPLFDAKGEPVVMAVNSQFVLEVLSTLNSDFVALAAQGPLAPLLVRPKNKEGAVADGYLHLIMPLKM